MNCYLLADEQGRASGQFKLGFMPDWGQGVLKNSKKAHMWFSLTAVKGTAAKV
jgi:TPR repeat protein